MEMDKSCFFFFFLFPFYTNINGERAVAHVRSTQNGDRAQTVRRLFFSSPSSLSLSRFFLFFFYFYSTGVRERE
jgi:hypothetical protein